MGIERVERVGAVVDSRGPVVGVVDADLVAGSAWTAGSTRVVPGLAVTVGATG
jgi:hypothetical protein